MKSAKRLVEEYRSEVNNLEWNFHGAITWLLNKIRARRDELLNYKQTEFWDMFDDGAEFGPDEHKTLIRRLAHPDGVLVEIQTEGRAETISEAAAEAIRADERRKIQEGP